MCMHEGAHNLGMCVVCGMWSSFMASSRVLWRGVALLCFVWGIDIWGKVHDRCMGWDWEREGEGEVRERERTFNVFRRYLIQTQIGVPDKVLRWYPSSGIIVVVICRESTICMLLVCTFLERYLNNSPLNCTCNCSTGAQNLLKRYLSEIGAPLIRTLCIVPAKW